MSNQSQFMYLHCRYAGASYRLLDAKKVAELAEVLKQCLASQTFHTLRMATFLEDADEELVNADEIVKRSLVLSGPANVDDVVWEDYACERAETKMALCVRGGWHKVVISSSASNPFDDNSDSMWTDDF